MSRLGLGSSLPDDRTRWYREAKFGMFIHWGPYSQASVEASWPIMTPTPGGISEAEYRDLPKRLTFRFLTQLQFAGAIGCLTLAIGKISLT